MKKVNKNTMITGLIITAFIMITGVSLYAQLPPWQEGAGNEESPFEISDADDLIAIGDVQNQQYLGSYFLQTADIDLDQNQNVLPIGDMAHPFTGSFNGDGFVIQNLTIDMAANDYAGLFGYINGASLENITIGINNIVGNNYVGGLVGYAYNSYIQNCSVISSGQNDPSIEGNEYIGGLVGYSDFDNVISKSYSNVFTLGSEYIGGLVGANDESSIENCFSIGLTEGHSWVAGLAAVQYDGEISNSYAAGSVVSNIAKSGGLVATVHPPTIGGLRGVSNSYWDRDATGQQYSDGGSSRETDDMTYPFDPDTYVGWDFQNIWSHDENHTYNNGYPVIGLFAGGNGSEDNPYQVATPSHLNNVREHLDAFYVQIADIDLDVYPFNGGEGWEPIGDINEPFEGYYDGNGRSIKNLLIDRPNNDYQGLFGIHNQPSMEPIPTSLKGLTLKDVKITGRNKVGALAGKIQSAKDRIVSCSSSGKVIGANNVGGLIGKGSEDSIALGFIDCFSEATVSDNDTSGEYFGGLIGYLNRGSFSKCYTSGDVSAPNSDKVGGLIGKMEDRGHPENNRNSRPIVPGGWQGMIPANIGAPSFFGESSFSIGNVTGNKYVGGLIGKTKGSYIDGGVNWLLTVESYASYGKVIAEEDYAGGLIGLVDKFSGVFISYSTSIVEGVGNEQDATTGGLIGVIVEPDVPVPNYYDVEDIQNVLYACWDIESSGQKQSAQFNNHPIRLTTVRMMQRDNFSFWYNESPWAIEEWHTEPFSTYPYFEWQTEGPDPVGIEHNEPVNKEYYQKYFYYDGSEEQWYWVSFPWLSRDKLLEDPEREEQTAEEALWPLAWIEFDDHQINEYAIIDRVQHYDGQNPPDPEPYEMVWSSSHLNPWDPDEIGTFCSTRGYKVRISDDYDAIEGDYNLPAYGSLMDPETEFTLYPGEWHNGNFIENENWIGYFLEDQQGWDEAFGDFLEDINFIKSQDGGVYRWLDTDLWILSGEPLSIDYGNMYKVGLNDDVLTPITDFHWNIPQGRSSSERQTTPRSRPQHFNISYGPDYESIFITEIADDEDVVEIGVYVDSVCVGASVFEDSYPLEILAYTDESHLNTTMTFVLYLDDESYEVYDNVPAKDLDTGQYSRQALSAQENLFSLIELDRTGQSRSLAAEDDSDKEETLQSVLRMEQNYPNPFSLRSGVRGHSQTSISFAVPENMPVELGIYNIRGQLVKSLVSGDVNRGQHTVGWNGRDSNNKKVASGIYFYRLETAEETITKKMIIVR